MSKNLLASILAFSSAPLLAAPLADIEIEMEKHKARGTYHYEFELTNAGPILEGVTTPANHVVVDYSVFPPQKYDANDKVLTDDSHIVLFGIDLGDDEVNVLAIKDRSGSLFHASEETGWRDSDGDGIPNKVIAWHLPFFGWTMDDTIAPGEKIKNIHFVLDKPLRNFVVWFGGSDDGLIWNDTSVMIEDEFGIYDASLEKYLAVFNERKVRAEIDD